MQRDQTFSVVDLCENGDRIVITRDTTHKTAEQIVSLMIGGSRFVNLFIEADAGGAAPVDSDSDVYGHRALAELIHPKLRPGWLGAREGRLTMGHSRCCALGVNPRSTATANLEKDEWETERIHPDRCASLACAVMAMIAS
jgi:hypothetical protein